MPKTASSARFNYTNTFGSSIPNNHSMRVIAQPVIIAGESRRLIPNATSVRVSQIHGTPVRKTSNFTTISAVKPRSSSVSTYVARTNMIGGAVERRPTATFQNYNTGSSYKPRYERMEPLVGYSTAD